MKTAFNVRLKRYYHKRKNIFEGFKFNMEIYYWSRAMLCNLISKSDRKNAGLKMRDRIDFICYILNTHHVTISSCTYNLSQLE